MKSVTKKRPLAVMIFGLTLLTAVIVSGQDLSFETTYTNSSGPRVIGMSGRVEMGQDITVDVQHLSDWAAAHDTRKLVPFLNGRSLRGEHPEQIDLSQNTLLFHLQRTPESKEVWTDLFLEHGLRRPVTLSVGLEDQSPFNTTFNSENKVSLIIIPTGRGIVSLIVVLCAGISFAYFVRTTNIIRVAGPPPEAGKKRFSLERAQMAFWFSLVSVVFICLWLITREVSLTPSVLGLLGISGATGLGGRIMTRANKVVPGDPNSTVSPKGFSIGRASGGFWRDILTNAEGYSFPCFQLVAWNIVLGVIFITSVCRTLAMLDFSEGLLALLSISAVTHLGFKALQEDVPARIVAAGR